MKKLLLAVVFTAFLSAGSAGAQGFGLPAAGLAPGNPFYFLDQLFEGVGTLLTFGSAAKAERYLALSEERLAEAQALAEGGSARAGEAVARFEAQAAKAKERASQAGVFDLENQVTDATTKHLAVLDEVLLRVPEEAKEAVRAAKERSIRGQIEALRGIAQRDPEAAVDIFSRAAEGRLRAAEARAQRGGDDGEEADEVEEALGEFSQYAEFGNEISTLAEGLQTGDTTVEELIERATSHHLDILGEVRLKAPEEAQEGIQKAMEESVVEPRREEPGSLDLPPQSGQRGSDEEEEDTEAGAEAEQAIPQGVPSSPGGRP